MKSKGYEGWLAAVSGAGEQSAEQIEATAAM